jgi:CRP-like cAMP-binding protein
LIFIREGKFRVTLVGEDGKEVVLAHLEQGGFFGEISLLTGKERTANVISMSECVLYILRQADFERHVQEHSGLALALLKALAIRLGKTSERVGDLVLFDVYRRIAKILYSMGEEQVIEGIRTRVVAKRPTHKELAAMAGTSREMVTRALKELEEDGILHLVGKDRVILYQSPG